MNLSKSNYISACYWEKGRRKINQDSLALWQLKKGKREQIFAIVCDGIGGLPEGENASGYVVRQTVAWFVSAGYRIRKIKHRICGLQQIFFQIHEELKEYGKEKGIGLGTTATFVWLEDGNYLWGHIGDSRLYHLGSRRVRQITEDHTLSSGALGRAVGAGEWQPLSVGAGRLRQGEGLLICSDGFYRNIRWTGRELSMGTDMEEEQKVLRRLQQLGERKLERGERDNLSAVYCGRIRKKRNKGEGV